MIKYIVLLPLHYNDGTAVPKRVLDDAIDEMYQLAGGYSLEGEVQGAYRMKSGHKQEDTLLKISVAIPSELEEELRSLVRKLCSRLQQECIWLERANSAIELIEP